MRIQLSEHFTSTKLFRFVLPSIVMMIFTSIYGVVDGFFVSNYVGKTAFAAVNLIYPLLIGMGSLGFMIGTGGSALIAKTLGEGENEHANRIFSMLIYTTVIGSIVLTVAGLILLRPIARMMGAQGALLEDCVLYGSILLVAQTAFMLQNVFQSFFATAEKPHLGLSITVAAGMTNIVLDALLIAVLGWGLAGAALASAFSQLVGGLIPLLYFRRKNTSLLRLTRARFDGRALLRVCLNGSSELMTNLSSSLVSILFNLQLLRLAGENGVAAYGVLMYVNFIFIAIYIGYSIGSAPLVGFHYGAGNRAELKNLFGKSLIAMGVLGVLLTALSQIMAQPLSRLFVGYDAQLLELTCHGMRLYSFSFLFSGVNIYGSAFFTALNNGGVSAAISFLRTLLFQLLLVLTLPSVLGIDGVWLSVPLAELFALGVTALFLVKMRGRYHYA